MNRFMLILAARTSNFLTFYFGFWTFIYDCAWWNKPLIESVPNSPLNLILFFAFLFFSVYFEYQILKLPQTSRARRKVEKKSEKDKVKEEFERVVG